MKPIATEMNAGKFRRGRTPAAYIPRVQSVATTLPHPLWLNALFVAPAGFTRGTLSKVVKVNFRHKFLNPKISTIPQIASYRLKVLGVVPALTFERVPARGPFLHDSQVVDLGPWSTLACSATEPAAPKSAGTESGSDGTRKASKPASELVFK